jgi:hypothetical protein
VRSCRLDGGKRARVVLGRGEIEAYGAGEKPVEPETSRPTISEWARRDGGAHAPSALMPPRRRQAGESRPRGGEIEAYGAGEKPVEPEVSRPTISQDLGALAPGTYELESAWVETGLREGRELRGQGEARKGKRTVGTLERPRVARTDQSGGAGGVLVVS